MTGVEPGTSCTERPTADLTDLADVPARRRVPAGHELHAWRSFLRAHAAVVRRLEADLLATHGLSLGVYDVLVQLVEAPGAGCA